MPRGTLSDGIGASAPTGMMRKIAEMLAGRAHIRKSESGGATDQLHTAQRQRMLIVGGSAHTGTASPGGN